jgi:hypothetical protein
VFVSSLQAVAIRPHTYIYPCHIFHVPDNVYTGAFFPYVHQPRGASKRLEGIWRFESVCI